LSRSPLLLAITWLTTCTAVLAAGLAVTLAPVETTVAWPTIAPWQTATTVTGPFALGLAALAGVLLILATGSAREGNRARPFGELLVFFPLVFAFVWLLLPPGRPDAVSIIFGLALLAAGLFLFRHWPGPVSDISWKRNKSSLSLDAAMVLFPVLTGLALGYSPDLKASGVSLFLYPLYAFIQLGIFLFIPVTRLRAMGVSSNNSTLFAALVFALIHWPNPLVMLVTLVGMLIWAHQFQRGRPLWQLALIMGLTATTFSQFLPDNLIRHMRVGPGFVRSEAVVLLGDESSIRTPSEFIEFAYPHTIGRPVLPEELQAYSKLVDEAIRSTWAYMFLNSPESRNHLVAANDKLPPAGVVHWSDWPDEMKTRISTFASDEYFRKVGGTRESYLKALYVDILGREAGHGEVKPWLKSMSKEQRRKIAQVLLEQRAQQGASVFKGMNIEEFRFPN